MYRQHTIATLKVLRTSDQGAFLDGQTGNTNDDTTKAIIISAETKHLPRLFFTNDNGTNLIKYFPPSIKRC